jgi:hypothetical protein
LPPEAPFQTYRDVAISSIVEQPPPAGDELVEVTYQGLLLECSLKGNERYRTPELILANPNLAGHLAADSMLVDPTGRLAVLRAEVACHCRRPRWAAPSRLRHSSPVSCSAATSRRKVAAWGERLTPRSRSLMARVLSWARSASCSWVSPAVRRNVDRIAPKERDSGKAATSGDGSIAAVL